MIIEATATGRTVEEAKENAIAQLSAAVDTEINFEIIDLPQSKVLGIFGGKEAKVRAYYEKADEPTAPSEKIEKQSAKPAAKVPEKAPAIDEQPVEKAVASSEKSEAKPLDVNDPVVKDVIKYLTDVLTLMGVENLKFGVSHADEAIMIDFDGNRLGTAIGRKGETLDALQHLCSLVANREKEDYFRVTLNPGGYRQKREETLTALAKKSASQALRSNRNVILEPMNSYERRIIHNAVQAVEGVSSWSVGENDHRRVCIGTSRDNKPYKPSTRTRSNYGSGNGNSSRSSYGNSGYNKGGFNKGSNNRGGRDGDRRPSQRVDAAPTREPRKDSSDLPLYGVIK